MRIKTGFHLALALGAALVAAAILSFGYAQFRMAEAVSQNEVLDAVTTEGMQLVQLTNEVLLYGEPRSVRQWREQHGDLTRFFEPRDAQPFAPQARKLLARIASHHADMGPLFESLMKAKEHPGRPQQADELRGILSSQLFQRAALLQAELRNLKEFAEDEMSTAYAVSRERMLVTFGVFASLFALFALATSMAFRRAVLRPLLQLEQAIREVNQGRHDSRATVFAGDEIGGVCSAFNALLDQQEHSRREIEFLAYHDVLTGLPNQLLAKDRVQQAIAYADRSSARLALLFLDLDNFKSINDSLGHRVGDALLKVVAQRLASCVRDTDTISRQGGDEFLVALPDVRDVDDIAAFAEKLLEKLSASFDIEGHELSTSASIGIALYPDDSGEFDALLKKADTALFEAKAAGRNTYRFFAERMNAEASEYLRMRNGLRRALADGEFVLHYQPQVDLASGAVVGAEALIRWQHPELGLVPPGRFIPVAEDSGLIVPIGEWVLREACWQAAAWRAGGLPRLTVAVNLSAIQFKRGDIEKTVADAIAAAGIEADLLELELTESILIRDTDAALATVRRLKALGVQLSIDDFGTGYSSLSYLKRLNVDKLKIDQSFVRDLASDPDDEAIVHAVIELARSLKLRTIAEGVEHEQGVSWLRLYGCDQAQGYHFARPMPAAEFERYMARMTAAQAVARA